MDETIFEIQAEFCKAMGNAMRLQVIHTLRDRPKTVTEIMQETGYSQSNISRHLSVLRGVEVVSAERRGTEMLYSLTDPNVRELCDLVRKMLSGHINRRSQLIRE
jgi:ArsR family transcriptional regulator, arsenate/arsenite/antimonite-responsive transcriptional repressor